MRLPFDRNLSFKLCRDGADLHPESSQVRLLGLAEADDRRVWEAAGAAGFVLVSQDADFADMALLHGPPPKVIWLRCENRPTAFVAALLRRHAEAVAAFGADDHAACLEIY